MNNISAIKNYILFLKSEFGLSITLHTLEYCSVLQSTELMSFNVHDNSYCIYMKTCPDARRICVEKQKNVLKKCKNGPYIGTCYAGVKEFVYPIFNGVKNIGFISVSGYKTENCNRRLNCVCEKYGLSLSELIKHYSTLKNEMPDKNKIGTLIQPLCDMLELALLKSNDITDHGIPFAEQIVRFIKQNHNQEINSEAICSHFTCSRSYMSAEFNKYMGMSIREYINKLRIDDAKYLLEHTKITATEIAFSVGFADSNYFSHIFKKSIGMSPLAYRKASRK